jgi:hypothetical protein
MPDRRKLAAAAAAVAVAAGTFVVLSPGDEDREAGPPPATTTAAPAAAAAITEVPPVTRTQPEVVSLRAGVPVGGVATIEVQSGDRVLLDVRSDTEQEVHVHGFDVTKTAAPGSPARFRFEAGIEGRFEVETHATGTVIAEITVTP